MGSVGKHLQVCLLYGSIPIMYLMLGLINLAYIIAPNPVFHFIEEKILIFVRKRVYAEVDQRLQMSSFLIVQLFTGIFS